MAIASVPLKAEINHESRCAQRDRQEVVWQDGEGEGGELAIKSQEGRNGIKEVIRERGNRARKLTIGFSVTNAYSGFCNRMVRSVTDIQWISQKIL